MDLIDDKIVLYESMIKAAKNQQRELQTYMEEIAEIMDRLKTDEVKQELAEITAENYKRAIELEINIAIAEQGLRIFKGMIE